MRIRFSARQISSPAKGQLTQVGFRTADLPPLSWNTDRIGGLRASVRNGCREPDCGHRYRRSSFKMRLRSCRCKACVFRSVSRMARASLVLWPSRSSSAINSSCLTRCRSPSATWRSAWASCCKRTARFMQHRIHPAVEMSLLFSASKST